MNKVYGSAQEALAGVVQDGQTLAVGGFDTLHHIKAFLNLVSKYKHHHKSMLTSCSKTKLPLGS